MAALGIKLKNSHSIYVSLNQMWTQRCPISVCINDADVFFHAQCILLVDSHVF